MQTSLRGVELRHAVTTQYTLTMLNMHTMQVDNQLPEPVAGVLLSPTAVRYPQPVVRLQIRKNNLLSQEALSSYE
jgi:hypothetical protein